MGCCNQHVDPPGLIAVALYGATGIAKVLLGMDRAGDGLIKARVKACYDCDQLRLKVQCAICKCAIHFKARLASEVCPLGKWPELQTDGTLALPEEPTPMLPPFINKGVQMFRIYPQKP